MKAGIYLGKEQIEIDRAEGEGCFLSEGQEDGHEMNGTNQDLPKNFSSEIQTAWP